MMNLTSSDRSGPVQYVDTAYDALKYNVPATQQIMQAAQQGQPVGLKGIGALAANRTQQQAQFIQQAQQAQQGMPPTVLQQALNSSGIMGQFQPNVEMGQAPTSPTLPPEMPQQMAMGGIVALNDGGFIDYSYDGGEGYARGGLLGDEEEAFDNQYEEEMENETLGDVGSGVYGLTPEQMERDAAAAQVLKDREDAARKVQARQAAANAEPSGILDIPGLIGSGVEKAKEFGRGITESREQAQKDYYATTEAPPSKKRAITEAEKSSEIPEAYRKSSAPYKEPTPKAAEPSYLSRGLDALGHLLEPSKSAGAEETPKDQPSAKAKAKGVEEKTVAHQRESAKPRKFQEVRGTTTTPLNPKAQTVAAPATPPPEEARPQEPTEPTPAAPQEAAPTPSPASTAGGIAAIPVSQQIEELQKLYMGDVTGKLSPETASRLASMEDQATRDKWLTALTAGASGLFGAETPYMSQAVASGAMKALSAYQQGAQNEEQAGLRTLQAQMAAEKEPEAARQKALSAWIQGQMAQGKSAADIRKAMISETGRESRFVRGEAGKAARSANYVDALKQSKTQADIYNIESQIGARRAQIIDEADKAAAEYIKNNVITDPQEQERIRQQYRQDRLRAANIPTFAGTGSATGLGGGAGMGGRPLIMGRNGALSTPQ